MAESYVKEAFLMPQNLVALGVGVVVAATLPFTGPVIVALEGMLQAGAKEAVRRHVQSY